MSSELGQIECFLCGEDMKLGDSLRFIRFDRTTLLFHESCRDVVWELIQETKQKIQDEALHTQNRI